MRGCRPLPGAGGVLSPMCSGSLRLEKWQGVQGAVRLLFCTILLGACWALYSGFGSLKLGTSE